MKVLAITGRMATGKSTILKQLKFLGVNSFSSDEIVNNIYKKDFEFISTIMNLYPQVIEQGKINKNELSNLAFNNKEILKKLEKLIYPILDRKRRNIIKTSFLNSIRLVVFEIPLLFEKKIDNKFCLVITTTCNKKIQKQRYLKRKNSTLKKFNFINNQFVEDNKRFKDSNFVINTGNGKHHSLLLLKKIINKI